MSDVNLEVNGLPFDARAIGGVSITYTYNTMPTASVQLVPGYVEQNAKEVLCDPDSLKSKTRESPVTIKLKSKTGCISFDGVFDGLSFNQSPGGMQYSAMFKSSFQPMLEIYPKFVGVDPISILPFKRSPMLKVQYGESRNPYEELRVSITNRLDLKKTIVECYVDLVKGILETQQNALYSTNLTQENSAIVDMLSQPEYQVSVQKGLDFLNSVNLDYVTDCSVKASSCVNFLLDRVLYAKDTLWDTMMAGLSDMGCMLLPGKSTLYIVPKSNFIKFSGGGNPGFREMATSPNTAYPADYTSFSINDASYRNLRGCYVTPVINDPHPHLLSDWLSAAMGVYPSASEQGVSDGATGLLIVPAPDFLIQNIEGFYTGNSDIQSKMKDSGTAHGDKIISSPDEVKSSRKQVVEDFKQIIPEVQEYLNNYAKSQFLQEKYAERGGSINMLLKPNWVPGTTGYVYSRHPGLAFHFYVESVTHYAHLGSGASGTAGSVVNFSSCRYAGSSGSVAGIDSDPLFNFDSGKMSSLQSDWLSDVEGSATIG